MTVSDVVEVPNPGGTSSEASIAPDRPGRGDLRRAEPGGQRRAAPGVHTGGAAGPGAAGEHGGPAGGPGGWVTAGSQGADVGARDGGGGLPHRSRRRVALG